jgi:hypothetical protein
MKALTSLWLTMLIALGLLAWLWATRDTIKPSLIMSLHDVLRAKAAADKPLWMPICPGFTPWPQCRIS